MSFVHRLAVVASAVGFPGLVKGLEVENINAPVEHRADSVLVVLLSVVGACLSLTVVGSAICSVISTRSNLETRLNKIQGEYTGRPARLAVTKSDLLSIVTSDLFDTGLGLSHVIEVGGGGVGDILVLPVGKPVGQAG